MNDAAAQEEKLTVPLGESLKRLQEESGFKGKNTMQALLLLAVLTYLLFKKGMVGGKLHPVSFLVIFMMALIVWHTVGKMRFAKKLKALYDGSGIPALTLDAVGFTCPVILMDYISKAPQYLMKNAQRSVQVKWADIERWAITPRSQRTMPGVYFIDLKKDAMLLELSRLVLHRDFSAAEEKDILGFAQRYVPVPIGPLPVEPEGGPNGAVRWRRIGIAVGIVALLMLLNLIRGWR